MANNTQYGLAGDFRTIFYVHVSQEKH